MDRAQEQQFINEHVCPWQQVKCTWLTFTVIVVGVTVIAWSPFVSPSTENNPMLQSDWFVSAPRLQHRDDDPDEFFDPSDL